MDEPFAARGAMTREQMNMELQRGRLERRKPVVLVTHSTSDAVFLADRVPVVASRPGRIAEVVSINNPRLRAPGVLNAGAFGEFLPAYPDGCRGDTKG
jgi:NitT/TauT family transport system ATP-binding protein